MRIYHQKSAAQAVEYHTKMSEYYGPGSEQKQGVYFGDGAALLGLTPDLDVDADTFSQLCHNTNPVTGKRLTKYNRDDRRVLTDLTLSAPKSVSVMWASNQDPRLLDAVQDAALQTFGDVEQDAMTRVNHSRGNLTLDKTRNLVGVAWLHTTARPIDGHPDPQIHVHGTVQNLTHTGKDRWTAIDLSAVVRDSGYFEALFQSRLASNLQKIGYEVERSEHNFEIKDVSRETIDKFSRRTELIEKTARSLGIKNKDAKDALGATTRDKKEKNLVPPEELPAKWRSRLTEEETTNLAIANAKPFDVTPTQSNRKDAVDFAIADRFANDSVIRKRQLVRSALLHGIGSATVEEIREEVDSRDLISEGQEENEAVTTREVLAEERSVLSFARRGRGQFRPLAPEHEISRDWLSDEQKAAVTGVLRSPDRLMIVRGVAGSGKTTLMRETVEAIEKQGKRVAILAPNAETVHDVLREKEGFDANTLASFLVSKKAQSDAADGVIMIDEAGLVGMEAMQSIAQIAEHVNARVILVGDNRQHSPVARGEPLRLLENQAGITPHEVATIRRQKDDNYRKSVTYLSEGEVEKGLDTLVKMGAVHEVGDDEERAKQIACDYADAVDANQSVLVVAPSHAEREEITEAIRDELKSRGHVHHQEHKIEILKSRRLSEARRGDAKSYTPGEDIIEFHRKAKGGWMPGSRVDVAEVRGDRVFTRGNGGLVEIPIDTPGSFDVYRSKATQFAVGDVLRITKNRQPVEGENTKRMNNGSQVTLTGIDNDGRMSLSNGQTIDSGWGHFDHGVTVTSHGSQGKTFKRVIIAQSSLSFPASSAEQAYVSVSRGEQNVSWYTDNVQALRHAITRDRGSKMAVELQPETKRSMSNSSVTKNSQGMRQRAQRFAAEQIGRLRSWLDTQQMQHARQ